MTLENPPGDHDASPTLREWVDRIVADAPPLTDDERRRIAALLLATPAAQLTPRQPTPPVIPTPVADTSAPCSWCGRPGSIRRHTEEAFGRVIVVDPVLCDVCAALLDLDLDLAGAQRHDSAREVALDVIGRGDPVPRRDSDLETARLRAERDEARGVARLLADELSALVRAGADESRLLATLPAWVAQGRS